MGDSKYFESLSRKAHEGAQSQAQVDVANARMIGRIGEAEKEGETKQKIAKINANTAILETERKVEKANADQKLKTREIEISRELNLEQIAADRAAEQRNAELSRAVEEKRAEMELERLRATDVVKAKIAREAANQKADADLYSSNKKADAQQYNQKAEVEAELYKRTKQAEACERDAEAAYYAKKREAEGLIEMSKAYGAMADVLGGPQGLMQYLMFTNGVYEKLAAQNAQAIKGLQPKINVWTTGNQDVADSTAPIRNLFQSLPPLLSTIQDQTGMQPPAWLAQMPQQSGEMSAEEKLAMKQRALVNGHK